MTASRRRWSFSLQTLLVVVTALAAPMAWLGWHLRIANARRESAEAIKRDGGAYIQRGPGCKMTTMRTVSGIGNVATTAKLLPAPWYVRVFGDDYYDDIIVPYEQFDERIGELARLFPEANIHKGPEPDDPPFPVKFELYPNRRAEGPKYLLLTLPEYAESTDSKDSPATQVDRPVDGNPTFDRLSRLE